MLFGLFGDRKERQARQLNRDAPVIIEQAEQMFTDNRLKEIADTTVSQLARAHEMFGRAPIDLQRAHYEYRTLHKEARRQNEQANLTALTLVIIYLRSEISGVPAAPARATIDQFIARWAAKPQSEPASPAPEA